MSSTITIATTWDSGPYPIFWECKQGNSAGREVREIPSEVYARYTAAKRELDEAESALEKYFEDKA